MRFMRSLTVLAAFAALAACRDGAAAAPRPADAGARGMPGSRTPGRAPSSPGTWRTGTAAPRRPPLPGGGRGGGVGRRRALGPGGPHRAVAGGGAAPPRRAPRALAVAALHRVGGMVGRDGPLRGGGHGARQPGAGDEPDLQPGPRREVRGGDYPGHVPAHLQPRGPWATTSTTAASSVRSLGLDYSALGNSKAILMHESGPRPGLPARAPALRPQQATSRSSTPTRTPASSTRYHGERWARTTRAPSCTTTRASSAGCTSPTGPGPRRRATGGRTTISAGDVSSWKSLYPGTGGGDLTPTVPYTINGAPPFDPPYNLRNGPGTSGTTVWWAPSAVGGVSVTIVCQANGDEPHRPVGVDQPVEQAGRRVRRQVDQRRVRVHGQRGDGGAAVLT